MASKASNRAPPHLPPRQSSSSNGAPYADAPPPYESIMPSEKDEDWATQDPRTASTQSLLPSESNVQNERRRLLLVYIHGFMGNESSFRSFPAHVHNLLTVLLAETHVVHTKIYPRYRSKKNISVARDNFSTWLEPHESESTDVVLLGHSMGGLLCAEVVLMPPAPPASRPLKHRILGTINFDVPFLGMHPGVVKSGLSSIFRSPDEPADAYSPAAGPSDAPSGTVSPISSLGQRTDTLWQPESVDPNFNPSFNNDVVLPMRKGWKNALHFISKHSSNLGELTKATQQLVTSHMEFGGAMANYTELKARYGRIRALEEENADVRKSIVKGSNVAPQRVRFVNYYTASTGRVRKHKSPLQGLSPSKNRSRTSLSPSVADESGRGRLGEDDTVTGSGAARSPSPQISLQEHSDEGVIKKEPDIPSSDDGEEDWNDAAETLTIGGPQQSEPSIAKPDSIASNSLVTVDSTSSLPPISELPPAPAPLDTSNIQDNATKKLVEKEHTRATKAYQRAVKDRERVIRDRKKLEDRRDKAAQKAKSKAEKQVKRELTQSEKEKLRLEEEKQRMEKEGRRMRGEPEPDPVPVERTDEDHALSLGADGSLDKPSDPVSDSEIVSADLAPAFSTLSTPSRSPSPSPVHSRSTSPGPSSTHASTYTTAESTKPHDEKKDRKFCSLPPADSTGQRDPCWVRVFMENVDEVGAHCGLFFVDERYERLVGEVADRIERWVREERDRQAALGWNHDGLAEDID